MDTSTSYRSARTEAIALARLAGPIAAGHVGQALMGVVDVAVVGRVSAASLGAVGLGNAIFFAVSIVAMGVTMGFDPLIAQAHGSGDIRRTRVLLGQAVWFSLIASIAFALILALAPALLEPFGIAPPLAAEARRFVYWRVPGLAPQLLFVALRAYLQAVGVARPIAVAAIVANLTNLLGDLLLVFGGAGLPAWTGPLRAIPALGSKGAAISTSISMFIQVAVLAWAASRVVPRGSIERVPWVPRARELLLAARVGLPVGLQMGAEAGVFALASLLAGRFGEATLSAHQVALTLASVTFTVALGIGAAGCVRVGQEVGARNTVGARRAGLVALACGAGFMGVCALAFWIAPATLCGWLTNKGDVIAIAVPLLAIAAVFQVFDAVQGVGASILRGAGDTRFAFLANVLGHYAIGLPVAYILGVRRGQGITGVWWGLCAGLMVVAAALFARFLAISSRPIAPLASSRPIH